MVDVGPENQFPCIHRTNLRIEASIQQKSNDMWTINTQFNVYTVFIELYFKR